MGDRRISARRGKAQRHAQTSLDQARSGAFSHSLSAHKSGALLARALAKRGWLVQQPAREFFCGIVASVSAGRRASRLGRRFDSASVTENVALLRRDRRARRGLGEPVLPFVLIDKISTW